MANRRMFAKSITNSSRFLMMPISAQCLYFHLGMNADDDGYCEHFTIMRMTGCKPDDLKILQAKEFVYVFDDKVLVVKDWKENNYLRPDRYTPSKYKDVYKMDTTGIPNVNQVGDTRYPQVRLGKVSKGKDKEPPDSVCEEIISYLNEKAGRNFEIGNEDHHRYIRLRWKKYPAVDKFKYVIDVCVLKWKDDDKMRDYLQPSTLFNGKFGEKLGWTLPKQQDHRTPAEIVQAMEDEAREVRRG